MTLRVPGGVVGGIGASKLQRALSAAERLLGGARGEHREYVGWALDPMLATAACAHTTGSIYITRLKDFSGKPFKTYRYSDAGATLKGLALYQDDAPPPGARPIGLVPGSVVWSASNNYAALPRALTLDPWRRYFIAYVPMAGVSAAVGYPSPPFLGAVEVAKISAPAFPARIDRGADAVTGGCDIPFIALISEDAFTNLTEVY